MLVKGGPGSKHKTYDNPKGHQWEILSLSNNKRGKQHQTNERKRRQKIRSNKNSSNNHQHKKNVMQGKKFGISSQHGKAATTLVTGTHPDSKIHEAKMGLIWGRQDPGGPHVGPMNLAIWAVKQREQISIKGQWWVQRLRANNRGGGGGGGGGRVAAKMVSNTT